MDDINSHRNKILRTIIFDFENLTLSTKTLSSQRDTLPIIGVFLLPSASSGTIRRNRAISQRWGGGYASSPKPLPSAGVRRRGDIAPRPDARRPGPVYPQHERFGRLLLDRMGALRDLPALKALSQAAAQPATPGRGGPPSPALQGASGVSLRLSRVVGFARLVCEPGQGHLPRVRRRRLWLRRVASPCCCTGSTTVTSSSRCPPPDLPNAVRPREGH